MLGLWSGFGLGLRLRVVLGFRQVLVLGFGKQSMTSNLALVMDIERAVEETMKALEVFPL